MGITVDRPLPDRVITVVMDDGRGWEGERSRGRGSGILGELTLAWSHERLARGTRLSATIPLAPAAYSSPMSSFQTSG